MDLVKKMLYTPIEKKKLIRIFISMKRGGRNGG